MTIARRLTPEEQKLGYAICDCTLFCHIFRSEILKRLPPDYHGELCKECGMFMCRVDKIRESSGK